MFITVMRGLPAIADVASVSNYSPAHRREFSVQVHDELANLRWQCLGGFSRSAVLIGVEQALHSIFFKLISFARQRSLGSAGFLCTLPWRLSEYYYGADLFVEFLFWPESPWPNTLPLIRPLSV